MTMTQPSAVIFDIGNVLLNWDIRALYRNYFDSDTAIARFVDETGLVAWNIEQDRGREWREAENLLIEEHPQYEREIKAFRAEWDKTVTHAIAGSVELKERLQAMNVPVFALSNFAADTFEQARERFPFLGEFDEAIISGREGLIKPDAAIYDLLLSRTGVEAQSCLFIDDSWPNIEAARKLGIHGHYFTSPEKLAHSLRLHGFSV